MRMHSAHGRKPVKIVLRRMNVLIIRRIFSRSVDSLGKAFTVGQIFQEEIAKLFFAREPVKMVLIFARKSRK